MKALWLISHWLHLVSATVWIGGVIFVVLVAGPALKARADAATQQAVTGYIVNRFRKVILAAIGLQVATGLINAYFRFGSFTTIANTAAGTVLMVKLALVTLMLVIFFVAPRLAHGGPSPEKMAEAVCCGHESAGETGGPAGHGGNGGKNPRQKISAALHLAMIALGLTVFFLAKLMAVV